MAGKRKRASESTEQKEQREEQTVTTLEQNDGADIEMLVGGDEQGHACQDYWHEPVCLTQEEDDGEEEEEEEDSSSSNAAGIGTVIAVVDGVTLRSGGWHATIGCDFECSSS
jgi:hypothetical protein